MSNTLPRETKAVNLWTKFQAPRAWEQMRQEHKLTLTAEIPIFPFKLFSYAPNLKCLILHTNPLLNWQITFSVVHFQPFQFLLSYTFPKDTCMMRDFHHNEEVTGIWWVGVHGSAKHSMRNRTESSTKRILVLTFNNWVLRKLWSKYLSDLALCQSQWQVSLNFLPCAKLKLPIT